jgi:isopentenyldiphosphate isomerase
LWPLTWANTVARHCFDTHDTFDHQAALRHLARHLFQRLNLSQRVEGVETLEYAVAHKADIVQEACKLGRLERLEVSLGRRLTDADNLMLIICIVAGVCHQHAQVQ